MRLPDHFLNHLALWYVVLFATPLFIAANNPSDMALGAPLLALILASACLIMTWITWFMGHLTPDGIAHRFGLLLAAAALVLAIQANLVHDLFFYGNFNGETINFRAYGAAFWNEWYAYLAGAVLVLLAYQWLRPRGIWPGLVPILSSTLLLVTVSGSLAKIGREAGQPEDVEPSVFDFSRQGNLIHLLPDGFQSDIAEQVLKENSELAARFEGFTLFSNHLGMFQGTAPSVPTLLTGEPFDLAGGHDYGAVTELVARTGYPGELADAGYRLDFVMISRAYCDPEADSCVSRPFNDMKPRGYYQHRNARLSYSFRILADLSLFRLVPMRLKEMVYDEGHWTFADTGLDGSAPWPDPVLREWSKKMRVGDGPPTFKFYHYIGTHIPPHWDEQCTYHRSLERSRDNYRAQAYCILSGIATLIDALKAAGIYDQTALVITGDHGCGIAPNDMNEPAQSTPLKPAMLGSARPAFLIKPRHAREALRFSSAPTSLADVAGTARALANNATSATDALGFAEDINRTRYFRPYSIPDFFSGKPVPHAEYEVEGDVRNSRNWNVNSIHAYRDAPSSYHAVNFRNAGPFMVGLRFDRANPDKEATWVNGHQLALLVSPPAGSGGQLDLKLSFHLPNWIPEQRLRYSVNDEPRSDWIGVHESEGYWQQVSLPVDPASITNGNNLVQIDFEHTALPPGIEHWKAAAVLRSVRFVRSPGADTDTAGDALP